MPYHYQRPRITVEQSPWQTFFEELPGMFFSFQKLKQQAVEAEKDREFKRANMYIADLMGSKRMYEKAIVDQTDKAVELGINMDALVAEHANKSPLHHTGGLQPLNEYLQVDVLKNAVDNLKFRHNEVNDNLKLVHQGRKDAHSIDINFDSKIDTSERATYEQSNPEILKALDMTEFPEAYWQGATGYLNDPKVRKSRQALSDLNRMINERVTDTDPDTPGLQWDPSDPRSADIQNALDAIQLQQVPAAHAALQKITGAQDPYARRPYNELSTLALESQGMIVGKDPRMGAIVKRSREDIMASEEFLNLTKQRQAALDSLQGLQVQQQRLPQLGEPGYGDPSFVSPEQKEQIALVEQTDKQLETMLSDTDVSRQEAAQTIMTQKNIAKLQKDAGDDLKLMDAGEERVKKSFDAAQDQRYRSLHSFYESGPLYARKTTSGKFPEKTPKWVKKIYEESEVLYSLLSRKAFPGVGGKHESEDEIKLIQQDIQKYISEIMTKSGYDPHADLETVFNAGKTVDQKARNVLNSPTFQQAVNPRGDGTYDPEKAAINLNELFNLHGVSQLRGILGIDLDEATMAQGKAIAHLYNVWFGLEQELIRRKGYSFERQDKQRDYEKVIQGL